MFTLTCTHVYLGSRNGHFINSPFNDLLRDNFYFISSLWWSIMLVDMTAVIFLWGDMPALLNEVFGPLLCPNQVDESIDQCRPPSLHRWSWVLFVIFFLQQQELIHASRKFDRENIRSTSGTAVANLTSIMSQLYYLVWGKMKLCTVNSIQLWVFFTCQGPFTHYCIYLWWSAL